MAKLESLHDLFIEELRDLYSAENQLTKALPLMAESANSPELRSAFEEHLVQTRGQIERLEKIFQALGESPKGKTCKAMEGLIEEAREMIEEEGDPAVKDAGSIGCAQKVEHYEIAGYGTARTFASLLGYDEAADLLQETLDEEGETDEKLTQLAESLNIEAETADDSDV